MLSFFGGGIAFWISDVVIPAFDPNEQRAAVTVACPLVLIVFYVAVMRLRRAERPGPSTAIFAICGMWVLALSFTMLAQEIRSEQGLGEFTWGDLGFLVVSSFLPTRTFLFVGLEGSLIALLVSTVTMVICHFAFEIDRWIVPPSLWGGLHHSKK